MTRALVTLAVLFAASAQATCMLTQCEQSVTRLDGTPVERVDNELVLAVNEPFVVRRKCMESCAVTGGTGPTSSWKPLETLFIQRLYRGVPCLTGGFSGVVIEPTDDPFARRVSTGLPAGHYRVEGLFVNVGPSPELECPPDPPPERIVPVELVPPPAVEPVRSFAREWQDRDATTWELGAGGWVGVRAGDVALGGTAVAGLHRLISFSRAPSSEKSGDSLETDATRWCTPVLCLGFGLLFAPPEVLLGNELGVEVRGSGGGTLAGAALVRAGARPFFRYAHGVVRTPSVVGVLLPEVGVEWHSMRGASFTTAWSIFPIDFRLGGPLSLSIDPFRVMLLVGPTGVAVEWGGELTLRFAP